MKSEKYNDRFKDAADNAARSSAAYEAKGRTRGVAGSVKANVGCLIGDEALEAEGHRQNAEGGKDRVKGRSRRPLKR